MLVLYLFWRYWGFSTSDKMLFYTKTLKRYKPTPIILPKIILDDDIQKILDRMKADEERFISMFEWKLIIQN